MFRDGKLNNSIQRASAGVAAGLALWNTANHYRSRYLEWQSDKYQNSLYSITISETDEYYFRKALAWVLSQVEQEERKHITLGALHGELVEVIERDSDYNFTIPFEGSEIEVRVKAIDPGPEAHNLAAAYGRMTKVWRDLVFVVPSLVVRENLLKFFRAEFAPTHEIEVLPDLYRSKKTGGWSMVKELKPRDPESIILPDGMMEDLLSDIQRFLDNEARYNNIGIPWHRGYLLEGPPGTGKSSTINAVSSHFKKDVHYLSLKDLDSDSSLIECVGDVSRGQILVLEDVDVFSATHNREEEHGETSGPTLGALLNVIDGLLTPDGIIIFMTTNRPEIIEEALLRPGRVDRRFRIDYLNQEQFDRMVFRYVGQDVKIELQRDDVAASEIVECLKSSFDNPPEYVADCIREVVSYGHQRKDYSRLNVSSRGPSDDDGGHVPPVRARRVQHAPKIQPKQRLL